MHQPDSDGVIRSCTPLQREPNVAGMPESPPLVIVSVTFFTSDGKPLYIHETWFDPDDQSPREQWFHVTDALAFVEERSNENRN